MVVLPKESMFIEKEKVKDIMIGYNEALKISNLINKTINGLSQFQ